MRKLFSISFLFCCLGFTALATIPTNEFDAIDNFTSYGSPQFSWPSYAPKDLSAQ